MILALFILLCIISGIALFTAHGKIRDGVVLNRLQSNILNSYYGVSNKVGLMTYRVLGWIGLVVMADRAYAEGAWLGAIVIIAYGFIAMRTQNFARKNKFVATDKAGNPVAGGKHLKVASVEQAAAVPQAAPSL